MLLNIIIHRFAYRDADELFKYIYDKLKSEIDGLITSYPKRVIMKYPYFNIRIYNGDPRMNLAGIVADIYNADSDQAIEYLNYAAMRSPLKCTKSVPIDELLDALIKSCGKEKKKMIKIENVEVVGWEHAIRGMRNPKNSWDRMDSEFHRKPKNYFDENGNPCTDIRSTVIGPNDHKLMMNLAKGGPVHAKYRRMIVVYMDITAPLYWWKEFDTYKVGTVANSCSTMHKVHAKEFELDDFSNDHLEDFSWNRLDDLIIHLNICRKNFIETKDKKWWWQIIQLLPSSYNQKRTVMLSYEVLHNMLNHRDPHKLDEWPIFCAEMRKLPYSELITGEVKESED